MSYNLAVGIFLSETLTSLAQVVADVFHFVFIQPLKLSVIDMVQSTTKELTESDDICHNNYGYYNCHCSLISTGNCFWLFLFKNYLKELLKQFSLMMKLSYISKKL